MGETRKAKGGGDSCSSPGPDNKHDTAEKASLIKQLTAYLERLQQFQVRWCASIAFGHQKICVSAHCTNLPNGKSLRQTDSIVTVKIRTNQVPNVSYYRMQF